MINCSCNNSYEKYHKISKNINVGMAFEEQFPPISYLKKRVYSTKEVNDEGILFSHLFDDSQSHITSFPYSTSSINMISPTYGNYVNTPISSNFELISDLIVKLDDKPRIITKSKIKSIRIKEFDNPNLDQAY